MPVLVNTSGFGRIQPVSHQPAFYISSPGFPHQDICSSSRNCFSSPPATNYLVLASQPQLSGLLVLDSPPVPRHHQQTHPAPQHQGMDWACSVYCSSTDRG
ncbi:hypothetical protein CesoFtcFv8_020038 [Champsocephalus esox]|uniref:Uncharacterized protein n=1 Tax=Champsocephalus esox TaxID=159716 RepID=A0AAN8BFL2_9TELE|nr:hypothetical protein CesoFtcFv8_020038 [Champsocephalus esox]